MKRGTDEFINKLEILSKRATDKQIRFVQELYRDVYGVKKDFSGYTKLEISKIIDVLKEANDKIRYAKAIIKRMETKHGIQNIK